MDVFRKYHVSNVFLEESSLTCSYAVLTFCKSEDAEAAIRQMDGQMMCGKKLKVRAVKTSSCNLSLAFENIKSVPSEIPQNKKGGFQTIESKVDFVSAPPKNDSTQPSQVQHDHTQAASVGGTLKNAFVNMSSSKVHPHFSTNQGMPAAPPCSPCTSNFMALRHQWMQQSHIYNGMPNFMYVPFSYPLYTLPNQTPFQSCVTHPSNCVLGNNMKSNVHARFGKDDGNPKHATLVKSIHSADGRSNPVMSPSIVFNKVTNDKTKIFQGDSSAKFMKDEQVMVKSVNEPASSFVIHHSETASQDKSHKMSITPASVHGVGTNVSDRLASSDKVKNISEPSNLRSAAPLRFPTSVPPSVMIPEAAFPSVNPNFSSGGLAHPSEHDSSANFDLSQQGDSLSPGRLDWSVFARLDAPSETPINTVGTQLNFTQFRRVINCLTELHKDATRAQIVGTLEEIRKKRGTFRGLTLPQIVLTTSSKLTENISPA